MNRKYVFIRNDDLYKKDELFLNVSEFLLKHNIPINYAIIPARLETELMRYLVRRKKRYPGLIDILQHGWRHTNYNLDKSDKYEFGTLRSYSQQKRDILKGYKRLKGAFGSMFLECFVPPYHGFDNTTLKIVDELSIPLFSAGVFIPSNKFSFSQIPAVVSINDYANDGKPLNIRLELMIKRFLSHMNSPNTFLGVVFHHKTIKKSRDLKSVFNFFMFLKKLEQEKHIFLVPISKIYKSLII